LHFIGLDCGTLKFYYQSTSCFNVCFMYFSGCRISVDYFLAIFRKTIFPCSVPFRFILPPRIT